MLKVSSNDAVKYALAFIDASFSDEQMAKSRCSETEHKASSTQITTQLIEDGC